MSLSGPFTQEQFETALQEKYKAGQNEETKTWLSSLRQEDLTDINLTKVFQTHMGKATPLYVLTRLFFEHNVEAVWLINHFTLPFLRSKCKHSSTTMLWYIASHVATKGSFPTFFNTLYDKLGNNLSFTDLTQSLPGDSERDLKVITLISCALTNGNFAIERFAELWSKFGKKFSLQELVKPVSVPVSIRSMSILNIFMTRMVIDKRTDNEGPMLRILLGIAIEKTPLSLTERLRLMKIIALQYFGEESLSDDFLATPIDDIDWWLHRFNEAMNNAKTIRSLNTQIAHLSLTIKTMKDDEDKKEWELLPGPGELLFSDGAKGEGSTPPPNPERETRLVLK